LKLSTVVKTIRQQDPAIRSGIEVLLYQGFWAMFNHKIAHRLYKWRLYFLSRAVSQVSRFFTGIEIHPGAKIGNGVFIDHGAGVVIGETCEIGDNVIMYQGVTLGGTGKDSGKRHPTVCSNVIIGAEALLLGPITIGEGSKIGAGAIVIKDVAPGSTIVGEPARNIKLEASVRTEIVQLKERFDKIEARLVQLERNLSDKSC